MGDVSKEDIIQACGYVTINEEGEENLNSTGFYEALLEAKGVYLDRSTVDDLERTISEQKEEVCQVLIPPKTAKALPPIAAIKANHFLVFFIFNRLRS